MILGKLVVPVDLDHPAAQAITLVWLILRANVLFRSSRCYLCCCCVYCVMQLCLECFEFVRSWDVKGMFSICYSLITCSLCLVVRTLVAWKGCFKLRVSCTELELVASFMSSGHGLLML
jgi:hypothetical protein